VEKQTEMKIIIILVAIIGAAFGTVLSMIVTSSAFLQVLAGLWVLFIFTKTYLILLNIEYQDKM